MNYKDFQDTVAKSVREMLPENYAVNIEEFSKNNGNKQVALLIYDDTKNVAPNLYLEDYYRQYDQGKDLEVICEKLVATYHEAMEQIVERDELNQANLNIDKRNIFPQLINREKNLDMLKEVPNRDYLDLSIMYRLQVGHDATAIIDNKMMKERLKVDEEVLYRTAITNLEENPMFMPEIKNMYPMRVLSNVSGTMGANVLLNDKFMSEVYEEVNGKMFLIPSSIHEFIALPKEHTSVDLIKAIIKEVNDTVVSSEDFLSYQPYCFDGHTIDLAKNYAYTVQINKGMGNEGSYETERLHQALNYIEEYKGSSATLNIKTESGECCIYDSNFGVLIKSDEDFKDMLSLIPELSNTYTLRYDVNAINQFIEEMREPKVNAIENEKSKSMEAEI